MHRDRTSAEAAAAKAHLDWLDFKKRGNLIKFIQALPAIYRYVWVKLPQFSLNSNGQNMQTARNMDDLVDSFIQVFAFETFDETAEELHKCKAMICPDPCPQKKMALTLMAVVVDVVEDLYKQRKNPQGDGRPGAINVVGKVTPEIWREFNFNEHPLELGSYTPRNKLIHAAMYVKARQEMENAPGFGGWKQV